jgi:dolichyl-phosphate-mannose--protein O-mannosyl transferase
MTNLMPNSIVFFIALVGLTVACVINIAILVIQTQQLRDKTILQPMKYLLMASVFGYIVATIPLMFVYADILWLHSGYNWVVPVAVLGNAFGKDIGSGMFYLIYRMR